MVVEDVMHAKFVDVWLWFDWSLFGLIGVCLGYVVVVQFERF